MNSGLEPLGPATGRCWAAPQWATPALTGLCPPAPTSPSPAEWKPRGRGSSSRGHRGEMVILVWLQGNDEQQHWAIPSSVAYWGLEAHMWERVLNTAERLISPILCPYPRTLQRSLLPHFRHLAELNLFFFPHAAPDKPQGKGSAGVRMGQPGASPS